MKKKIIPVNEPLFIGNEKKYLNECIDKGWIGSDGEFVKKFENKLSSYVGRKYAITVSSGTAALDVAFKALNLKKNDEVILPTFTIISCLNPILRAGAKPIFIDCDPNTWNMDLNILKKKISKNTKIILAVHIYGIPTNMYKLSIIAKKYKIKIIEDASEQIGQKIFKKKCGSFGDISTFSFYTNKHITTGEGGMIFTDNQRLAEKCKKIKNLFFEKKRFIHKDIGWNYRMSNIQAAVGLAQFEKIKDFIRIKRNIGKKYYQELYNEKYLHLQTYSTNYAKNIYWVFGLVLKKNCPLSVNELRKKLLVRGIQTRPFFYCLHKQPIIKNYNRKIKEFINAEYLSKRGFYLPSGLSLTNKQIKFVIKELKKILSKD